jgi:arginase family enzyme
VDSSAFRKPIFIPMLEHVLRPVDPQSVAEEARNYPGTWGSVTEFPQPTELEDLKVDLALIGVPGTRMQAGQWVSDRGPDRIRRSLYTLAAGNEHQRIADLGDIIPGESPRDTMVALREVISFLLEKNILPIILGSGHEYSLAAYEAYEAAERSVHLVSVDARIDLVAKDEVDGSSWMWHVIDREPSFLFQMTQIAFQTHFVPPTMLDGFEQLHFEPLRLGKIREDIKHVEPAVRDADFLSFDLSAIRFADAPAHPLAGPNGLFGEEACQVMRYAGISDKLSCCGLFGYDPDLDRRGISAALMAQMVWYFVDGYYNRKGDSPPRQRDEFLRYRVHVAGDDGYEMNFLKSIRSGRWWMEIPFKPDDKEEIPALLPCSYADYEMALKQEVPDRWLRAYKRLNV